MSSNETTHWCPKHNRAWIDCPAGECPWCKLDNVAMMLRRAIHRMKWGEVDIDDTPSHNHKEFIGQATALLSRYGLLGTVMREPE